MSFAKMISTLAICLFFCACSETEKLSEMHDSTGKMEKTTREMNQTTGDMAQTTGEMNKTTNRLADTTDKMSDTTQDLSRKTEDMKNTTNELYDALRQGNALQLRREAWNSLLQAPSMFKKISEAAKYYMSYEVQLWNQNGQDNDLNKRNILAQQATQEFFLEIEDLAPRNGKVDVKAEPNTQDIHSDENLTASFNALAISMHQINRKQMTTLHQDEKLEKVSMLSLMEEALLAKNNIQLGTADLGSKEAFIREVLAHEEKAIQILQTRYNFFPMIFIDAATKISDKSLLGKAKMMIFQWDLDLDQMNLKQLEYYQTEVLQQSIAARNFLIKIGVKPVLDDTVISLLKKMKIVAKGEKSAQVTAAQTQIVGMLHEIYPDIKSDIK